MDKLFGTFQKLNGSGDFRLMRTSNFAKNKGMGLATVVKPAESYCGALATDPSNGTSS